ncbi:hypothetical protein HY095_01255 [Candidatus Micrarchaeota archaeon]|nr:hypothetical protein [Candidatus Micrarchaeota archaeon]
MRTTPSAWQILLHVLSGGLNLNCAPYMSSVITVAMKARRDGDEVL